MSTTVKALPTTYAGIEFRSRLEARWALFFDELGITWAYEPEGFELPSGNYLPDFWLPGVNGGCWFEVKGQNPTPREQNLAIELSFATHGRQVFIAHGQLPRHHDRCGPVEGQGFDICVFAHRPQRDEDDYYVDVFQAWTKCRCGRIGIATYCLTHYVCPDCPTGEPIGAGPDVVRAYETARTHRFWTPAR